MESRVLLNEEGHVLFKQLISPDKGQPGSWLDTDMSADRTPDESGYTMENAFLLGVALSNETTTEDIQRRLKQGETIYLVKPIEQRPPISTEPSPTQ